MRTPRDPYSVLGIEADATFDDAKAAYRRLAEIFHPDRFADARPDVQAEAERQMKDLNGAWRTLRIRFGHEDEVEVDPNRRDRWARAQTGSSDRDRVWDTGDDFSTRARQARTRQRAQERRSSSNEARADAAQREREEAAERDAFVRDARERLLREEAEQRRASPSGADPSSSR
jgi:curved DNA-binding protein CbpA